MEKEDTFPRFSSDMIDLLDECFPVPQVPDTLKAWSLFNREALYAMAFKAGTRAVVDAAKRLRSEKEEALGGPPADDPGALSGEPGQRVAGAHHHVREVSVGGVDPVDFREAGVLPDQDIVEE